MTLLATLEDFFKARGEDPPLEAEHESVMRAKLALEVASDMVRLRTGRDWDRSEGTVIIDGPGTDSVLLPNPPIAEVLTVTTLSSSGEETEVDAANYRLDPDAGILRRIDGGTWPRGWQNIEIEQVSGYDLPGVAEESGTDVPALPKALVGIVISVAARLYDLNVVAASGAASVGSLKEVTMGIYHEGYMTAADLASASALEGGFTELEADILDRLSLVRVA